MPDPISIEKAALLLILIQSVITFALFGIDKSKAVRNEWRISEKTLLTFSFLFGAAGGLCGMMVFHHKTQKWKFKILVPFFAILHLALLCYGAYAAVHSPAAGGWERLSAFGMYSTLFH